MGAASDGGAPDAGAIEAAVAPDPLASPAAGFGRGAATIGAFNGRAGETILVNQSVITTPSAKASKLAAIMSKAGRTQ